MFVKGNPVDREPMVAFDIDGVLVADLAPWAANDKGLVGCRREYEALDDFYRRRVNEQRPLFAVRDPFIAITGRQYSPSSEQWLFSTQPQCAGVHFYDVGGDFSQESLIAHKRMALARTNVRRFWESNPRKVAALNNPSALNMKGQTILVKCFGEEIERHLSASVACASAELSS